jgi:hypothetical protein
LKLVPMDTCSPALGLHFGDGLPRWWNRPHLVSLTSQFPTIVTASHRIFHGRFFPLWSSQVFAKISFFRYFMRHILFCNMNTFYGYMYVCTSLVPRPALFSVTRKLSQWCYPVQINYRSTTSLFLASCTWLSIPSPVMAIA